MTAPRSKAPSPPPGPPQGDDALAYMRCFVDMSRRMGQVGAALKLDENADPTDIYAEANAHRSLVERLTKYIRKGDFDLAQTAIERFWETREDPTEDADAR